MTMRHKTTNNETSKKLESQREAKQILLVIKAITKREVRISSLNKSKVLIEEITTYLRPLTKKLRMLFFRFKLKQEFLIQ